MTTILLVDDEEPNRALIHAYLAESGLTIVDACSGEQAIELADRIDPDLVLLDVLMPGLDGIQTVQRLKAKPRDIFMPVILVTALTDQGSRRRGLLAGADDFLSKPVDPLELGARIGNLLSLREKERVLLGKNAELADLHRFKKEISVLLVHDLKNPLSASLAGIEHALQSCRCGGDTRDALEDSFRANHKLQAMVADLLHLESLENARFVVTWSTFALGPWIDSVLRPRRWEAALREVSLENRVGPGPMIRCDAALLGRVLDNLVDNALRYTPRNGRIVLDCVSDERGVVAVRVGNTGSPIRPSLRPVIFEKYAQGASSNPMNRGFGLYFCRLAAEAHGGQISVEETAEFPTVMVIELPGSVASAK